MESIFCCNNLQPFRPTKVDHQAKFTSFFEWAQIPRSAAGGNSLTDVETLRGARDGNWTYAIQLVRQVNNGPLKSKRYFVPQDDKEGFNEITERNLIDANFTKVNSYKNFKCVAHEKFFELSLYQKDPVNRHHWRANIARPADDINLKTGRDEQNSLQKKTNDETQIDEHQPGTTVDASIPRSLTRASKTGLEEITIKIGKASLGSPGSQMLVTVSGDDDNDNDDGDDYNSNYYTSDTYGDAGEHFDYTACSLECGYCGRCDY